MWGSGGRRGFLGADLQVRNNVLKNKPYLKRLRYFGALLAVAHTPSCPWDFSGYTFTKLNQFCWQVVSAIQLKLLIAKKFSSSGGKGIFFRAIPVLLPP